MGASVALAVQVVRIRRRRFRPMSPSCPNADRTASTNAEFRRLPPAPQVRSGNNSRPAPTARRPADFFWGGMMRRLIFQSGHRGARAPPRIRKLARSSPPRSRRRVDSARRQSARAALQPAQPGHRRQRRPAGPCLVRGNPRARRLPEHAAGDRRHALHDRPRGAACYAFDAKSGKQLWKVDPEAPREIAATSICCNISNRGAAYADGKIIRGTIDGRLMAVDAKTGKKAWEARVADPTSCSIRSPARRASAMACVFIGVGRRGVLHPRLPRCVRREDGQEGVEVLHRAGRSVEGQGRRGIRRA